MPRVAIERDVSGVRARGENGANVDDEHVAVERGRRERRARALARTTMLDDRDVFVVLLRRRARARDGEGVRGRGRRRRRRGAMRGVRAKDDAVRQSRAVSSDDARGGRVGRCEVFGVRRDRPWEWVVDGGSRGGGGGAGAARTVLVVRTERETRRRARRGTTRDVRESLFDVCESDARVRAVRGGVREDW